VTSASSKPKTEAYKPVRGVTLTATGINLEAKEMGGTSGIFFSLFLLLSFLYWEQNPSKTLG
jgi:hypothetical protein